MKKRYSKYFALLLLIGVIVFGSLLAKKNPVLGGDEACPVGDQCFDHTTLNQWSCETCPSYVYKCHITLRDCDFAFNTCRDYEGACLPVCSDLSYIGECSVLNVIVDCNTSLNNCAWTGVLQNCNWSGGSCSEPTSSTSRGCCAPGGSTPGPTSTPPPSPPSCTVSLDPSTVNIGQGADANYIATVTVGSGSIDYVSFSSNNPAVATIDPASDASSPYQTIGETLSVGSTTITANVVMDGVTRCSGTATLNVTDPGPWWQVIDSDIITSGDIISSIPLSCVLPGCNPLLGLEGLGGFPGVPVYGGSDLITGEGGVSTPGWSANAQSLFDKIYDYSFFSRLVRSDVVLTEIEESSVNGGFFASGGAPSRGFVWYHFDGDTFGDLTINSSVNMPGDRKVVVLVENADLYINDRINVVDGTGFMMFVVGKNGSGNKGNIYIDADVSHPSAVEIEGVFLSEGQIRTGEGDNQLHIRGMVAAYDGVVLERDLEGDNAGEPAEVFEFAPDFILNFPRDLTFKRLRWKEVAP